MLTRNDCGHTATLACVVGLLFGLNVGNADDPKPIQHKSPYLSVSLSLQQPALVHCPSMRQAKASSSANGLRPPKPSQVAYTVQSQDKAGLIWQYRPELATDSAPTWVIALGERTLSLTSHWIDSAPAGGLELEFDPALCHATLLGHCRSDGTIALPALLHLPDQGSIRISAPGTPQAYLTYDARCADQGYIRVGFPAATQEQAKIHYEWEIISVAPQLPESEKDPRFAALQSQLAEYSPVESATAHAGQSCGERYVRLLPVRVCRHCPAHAAAGRRAHRPRSDPAIVGSVS